MCIATLKSPVYGAHGAEVHQYGGLKILQRSGINCSYVDYLLFVQSQVVVKTHFSLLLIPILLNHEVNIIIIQHF